MCAIQQTFPPCCVCVSVYANVCHTLEHVTIAHGDEEMIVDSLFDQRGKVYKGFHHLSYSRLLFSLCVCGAADKGHNDRLQTTAISPSGRGWQMYSCQQRWEKRSEQHVTYKLGEEMNESLPKNTLTPFKVYPEIEFNFFSHRILWPHADNSEMTESKKIFTHFRRKLKRGRRAFISGMLQRLTFAWLLFFDIFTAARKHTSVCVTNFDIINVTISSKMMMMMIVVICAKNVRVYVPLLPATLQLSLSMYVQRMNASFHH